MTPEDLPHYWINHLGFLMRKRIAADFAAAGLALTAEEWAILLILQAHTGLTPSELSARSLRDRTTVTRMIDRMAAKGLVERQADRDDRRIQRLMLTGEGRALFARARPIAMALIARSVVGVDRADLENARQVLSQMAANLEDTRKEAER